MSVAFLTLSTQPRWGQGFTSVLHSEEKTKAETLPMTMAMARPRHNTAAQWLVVVAPNQEYPSSQGTFANCRDMFGHHTRKVWLGLTKGQMIRCSNSTILRIGLRTSETPKRRNLVLENCLVECFHFATEK